MIDNQIARPIKVKYVSCPECRGRGVVPDRDGDGYGSEVTCRDCEGSGEVKQYE